MPPRSAPKQPNSKQPPSKQPTSRQPVSKQSASTSAPASASPSAAAPDMLGRTLLPLRAFLGFTFCFAGLQKLANPGFFDASNPVSIQAQLAGAGRRSPIHALISPLGHVAVAVGILIAFGELAVGVGTLLGLWARIAAVGGMVLSLMLFLTVSFHSAPYYTGADIVFFFAWMPLMMAGAGAFFSADAVIAERARSKPRPASRGQRQGAGRSAHVPDASRREMVLKSTVTAVVGFASLIGGGIVAGLGRLAGGTSGKTGGTTSLPGISSATPSASATGTGSAGTGPAPAGKVIGPANGVPVGQAVQVTDPATGTPSIVIQPKAGSFVAFNAVCPHAGCTVGYDASQQVIVCPCHGSQFNASTGAVEVGPAPTGLTKLQITDHNGQLYVT